MRVVLSSGHGKYIRGASGYLDEVDEARRVVEAVAAYLRTNGVEAITYHDNVSTTQDENLERIVEAHNAKQRDLDVSVHFNAYETTSKPMGVECFYYSGNSKTQQLSAAITDQIATATNLPDRGAKPTTGLYVINHTEMPCVLIETCFVDSTTDAAAYNGNFDAICAGIAEALSGHDIAVPPDLPDYPEVGEPLFYARGKCSSFGGPRDTGVSPSEGLAMYTDINQAPWLFLPFQPANTTGLARRLNPAVPYIACRWDYDVTPKNMLRQGIAKISANGISLKTFIGDWGPHEDTGRVADLSPVLMDNLGLSTDDEVEVIFPWVAE